MSNKEANPDSRKTDLNSNLPFSSCQSCASFGYLSEVGRSLTSNDSTDNSSSYRPTGVEACHHKEAFRVPQKQVQRFLSTCSIGEDEISLQSENDISTDDVQIPSKRKGFVDCDMAAATLKSNSQKATSDLQIATSSSCSIPVDEVDDISFRTLATTHNRNLIQDPHDSTAEQGFQSQAFRIPQKRRETFLSIDDDENERGDCDKTAGVKGIPGLDDNTFHGCESTVEADVKPSFLNLEGFLETLSDDVQLQYAMTKRRRGLALIFNNDEFDSRLRLGRRSGTDADTLQLKRQFEKLDFEVHVYRNLSLEKLKRIIKQASSADHSDADSFLCALLTHGDDDGIIYASDGSIRLQDLLDEFRGDQCPSLLGKPKIFIIQACRGRECEVGVCEVDGGMEETDARKMKQHPATIVDDGTCTTIPAGADFLVCYSVVEGYYSFRDTVSGSWYIQALCKAMETNSSSLEFTLLLTYVNRMVAAKCVVRTLSPQMIGRKQMPCFVSMLTKQLIFSPKKHLQSEEKVKFDCFFR